ncbi:MAG: 5'/3'-nucleotidase SurE, partial [Pseudomonadota bacterium]
QSCHMPTYDGVAALGAPARTGLHRHRFVGVELPDVPEIRLEGALLGLKSIALSQAYNFAEGVRHVKWETCEALAPAIIEKLVGADFPKKTFVNVNFPHCGPEEITGVEVTAQGKFSHGLFMEKRHDGRGFPYYWIRFGRDVDDEVAQSDITALMEKRVSITPLKLDLTDVAFKTSLEGLF